MRTKIDPSVRETQSFIEAARRAQLVRATLETIADVGFMNASLSRIAERAGISKGVIGYYFPSKDDLVKAVVEHFYMTGHEQIVAHLATATSATQMLRAYITQNIAYIANHRVETRAIGEIVANFRGPDGEPVYKLQDAEQMVEGTAAMFAWGQQAGEFRKFDTRVMAVMLRASIDGFSHQLAAYPDIDVAHYTEEMVQLFTAAARKTT